MESVFVYRSASPGRCPSAVSELTSRFDQAGAAGMWGTRASGFGLSGRKNETQSQASSERGAKDASQENGCIKI